MKYTTGFRLINCLEQDGLMWKKAAAVAILKGQALFDDGSGFATNAVTAFSNLFYGVAGAAIDNSGGDAGDVDVPVIPPRPSYKFIVPNGSVTVIAATDRSDTVDLEAAGSIDVTDTTIKDWGFMIDEIDISTAALAAAAGGYAIGRFVKEGDQT